MAEDHEVCVARGRLSRRGFLRGGTLLTGSLMVGGLLQACGSQQAPPNPPTQPPAKPAATAAPAAGGAPTQAPAAKPADAAKPAEAPKPAAAAGTPRRGGTLVVGKTAEATDLDPHLTNAVSRQRVTQLMYSYLVQTDAELKVQPDLAERWEIAPDGKTYTFFLRKGVKFHNGRELVADDVKFSIERNILNKTQGAGLVTSIDGIETPDPSTVRITLNGPDAALLASLASAWFGIVAKEEIDKAGGDLRKSAAGSGPFVLEEWVPNQTLKLRRNPDYYVQGQPYLDGITFQVIPEESTIVAQLRSGNVHLALLEDNKNYQLVRDAPGLVTTRSARQGFDYLNINNQKPPFDKLEVRQAISYAVDRAEVMQVAASGLGTLIAPIPPALKEYALDPATLPEYKPDLDKAKQLLAQAGFPNGFATEIQSVPTLPTMFNGMQVIGDQLKKVGIEAELKPIEYGIWLKSFNDKEFIMTTNLSGGNADPDSLLFNRIHSSGANQNNWKDAEVDALLEQGKAAIDVARRKEIYTQVQKMLVTKVPQLWLFSADLIHAMKASVKDYEPHPSSFFQGLTTTWLEG